MENLSQKTERAKEVVNGTFQYLQKNLAENTPIQCLTVIGIMQDNLNMLSMSIKLDIVNNDIKNIENDREKLDEYVKLKAKIDSRRKYIEQPF